MTWLKSLAALFQALLKALGMWERHQERGTGAALQRERDNAEELDRLARAAEAGADPALADAGGMRDDENNRDNRR